MLSDTMPSLKLKWLYDSQQRFIIVVSLLTFSPVSSNKYISKYCIRAETVVWFWKIMLLQVSQTYREVWKKLDLHLLNTSSYKPAVLGMFRVERWK